MANESLTDDLVSEPLNAEQARAKCEEAAATILSKHAIGGHWQWLDEKRLRVYKANGDAFMTLVIEALQ